MVERYSITVSRQAIADRFHVDVPDFYKPHYNAAPTHLLPVITQTSPEGVSLFYWGIPPDWAKNKTVSEKIVNLKLESLREKPSLRKTLLKRRCIIPADGFYAWKKVGKKTMVPYRFVPADKGMFAIAGVWEDFEDNAGDENHTFMMITRPASSTVSGTTDRMPMIIRPDQEKIWLTDSADEGALSNLLATEHETQFSSYTVSPRINTISIDVPSLIIPTPPADQHGNLTLFD